MSVLSPALPPAAPLPGADSPAADSPAVDSPAVRLFRRVAAALTGAEQAVTAAPFCRGTVSRAAFALEQFSGMARSHQEQLSAAGCHTLRRCHAAALALRALARLLEAWDVLAEVDGAASAAARHACREAAAQRAAADAACRAVARRARRLLDSARTCQEGWLDDLLRELPAAEVSHDR